MFWSLKLDSLENWAFATEVFSKEECEKIIKIGKNLKPEKAITFSKKENIRLSKTSWIYPQEETNWIYKKLTDVVLLTNEKYFNFNLFGFAEGLQFTIYESPGGKYEPHLDRGNFSSIRKLSLVVQLSNSEKYVGGDLSFHLSDTPTVAPKKQGTVIVFPSYILHGVQPVIKGTRYSLVAWITGPQFK
jgi:PKHD-type hydroxylase